MLGRLIPQSSVEESTDPRARPLLPLHHQRDRFVIRVQCAQGSRDGPSSSIDHRPPSSRVLPDDLRPKYSAFHQARDSYAASFLWKCAPGTQGLRDELQLFSPARRQREILFLRKPNSKPSTLFDQSECFLFIRHKIRATVTSYYDRAAGIPHSCRAVPIPTS